MSDARARWSYSTGEWGRNRVRAFEHARTGRLFLEFADRGRRKRLALGHRDRESAKAKAEEVAAALRHAETPMGAVPTLKMLFDNYLREVTPQKSEGTQKHDRHAAEMLKSLFGADRRASTLNRRDWDAFIAWRRAGGDTRKGKAKGRTVGARIVESDLKLLHAVLNWAVMARDNAGRYLLHRNPLKGMPWPKEDSPRRPALTTKDYKAVLKVARRIDERCSLALALAHETGHRIGAIRLLRWSDVDLRGATVHWRGEQDKIGFDHTTPLSSDALKALKAERRKRPVIGDAWLFPSPTDPAQPCSRHLFRDWWEQLERLAKLKHEAGRGWHSLRRKFATELKDVPLPDLCHLGGWKDVQTVLKCYQKADVTTMRAALAFRGRLGAKGNLERPNRHRESTPRSELARSKRPA